MSTTPDKAVTAALDGYARSIGATDFAALATKIGQWDADLIRQTIEPALSAALPYLHQTGPRLVPGDIPITERTPHGVWIADGTDPEPHPNPDLPDCDGLDGCDDCIVYNALRQYLVEQITALDEQHQRETADLRSRLSAVQILVEKAYGRDEGVECYVVDEIYAQANLNTSPRGEQS